MTTKMNPVRNPRSSTQTQVLEFLREHPGSTKQEIVDFLGPECDRAYVGGVLNTLKYRKNAIENRGGHASLGRWFLKETPSAEEMPYIQEAQTILDELLVLQPAFRVEYLAKKIEEIVLEELSA